MDLRVFVLQISQHASNDGVKTPLVAHVEHIHAVIFN
jgi:hypothetical protein